MLAWKLCSKDAMSFKDEMVLEPVYSSVQKNGPIAGATIARMSALQSTVQASAASGAAMRASNLSARRCACTLSSGTAVHSQSRARSEGPR